MQRPGAPAVVSGFGAVLLGISLGFHVSELRRLDGDLGPVLALFLDGVLALVLLAAGGWLARTDLAPDERWIVARWVLGGAVLFALTIGLSFLVKLVENRPLIEPQFTLLLAAEAGAIAGVVAGYFRGRAVADARHARRASDGLAFVNGLIRHDLRNDLQVIASYASLVTEDADDQDVTDWAASIEKKATEATDRIEVTESVADALSGESELERIDLASVVRDVAENAAEPSHAEIRIDVPDDAPVRASPAVRSLVDNLVENAIEHNDADEPRVDVAVRPDDEVVRLHVSDNGPGIPPSDREELFEGTDLGGLGIVRQLVDTYDGRIQIEGEDGGTIVEVSLPRAT